ncbi:hypothetical protein [Sinorhizobium meliloti]
MAFVIDVFSRSNLGLALVLRGDLAAIPTLACGTETRPHPQEVAEE